MHGKNLASVLSLVLALLTIAAMAPAQGWKGQSTVANSNSTAGNANKSTTSRKRRVTGDKASKKPAVVRCDPDKQQPADLSGTYKGVVNYPDGGLNGDATLTITGNQFLLVVGNAAQTGRITAVTTCTYTAATMMFGEAKKAEPGQPAPPPLPVISLRAVKSGNDVTLTTASGERRTFSFAPKAAK